MIQKIEESELIFSKKILTSHGFFSEKKFVQLFSRNMLIRLILFRILV